MFPNVCTIFIALVIIWLSLVPVTVVPRCSIRPDKFVTLPRVSPTSQPWRSSMESFHKLLLLKRVNGNQISQILYAFILCIRPSFRIRKVLVTFSIEFRPSSLTNCMIQAKFIVDFFPKSCKGHMCWWPRLLWVALPGSAHKSCNLIPFTNLYLDSNPFFPNINPKFSHPSCAQNIWCRSPESRVQRGSLLFFFSDD